VLEYSVKYSDENIEYSVKGVTSESLLGELNVRAVSPRYSFVG